MTVLTVDGQLITVERGVEDTVADRAPLWIGYFLC